MRKPEFSKDYEGLKRQVSALYNLVNSLEQQNSILRKRVQELEKQIALTSTEEIDSLRELVEQLTNELEGIPDNPWKILEENNAKS